MEKDNMEPGGGTEQHDDEINQRNELDNKGKGVVGNENMGDHEEEEGLSVDCGNRRTESPWGVGAKGSEIPRLNQTIPMENSMEENNIGVNENPTPGDPILKCIQELEDKEFGKDNDNGNDEDVECSQIHGEDLPSQTPGEVNISQTFDLNNEPNDSQGSLGIAGEDDIGDCRIQKSKNKEKKKNQ
ncbi:hypothetical protein L2E82_36348 [Cichorium intybus]|uniref:Uncharacterized protein n=1 Tax=Cichorium intybus TaxID=13427 RepID=A0ACB9BRE6_CICIN|nr:hypothetical protein L2E82_36348 [Cichorium intybus]